MAVSILRFTHLEFFIGQIQGGPSIISCCVPIFTVTDFLSVSADISAMMMAGTVNIVGGRCLVNVVRFM